MSSPVLACAAFVGGLILLLAGAYTSRGADVLWQPTQYGYPGQLLIGPLILVCVGVALRHRRPLLTLGLGTAGFAGDLVLGGSLGTLLIFTDNLYAACIYGPRTLAKRLLYLAAFLTAGTGAVVFVLWRHLGLSVILLVVVAMVLISPVLTAMVVQQHRDRAEAERVRADQVARLAEMDRRAAIAAERTRMARELHDVIANHFSVITLQATAALSRQDLDAQAVREMLATIRENGVRGLDEMRTMIDVLRVDDGNGGGAEEPPATPAMLSEADRLIERAGGAAHLETTGTSRDLPPAVDLAAFRILQESLTNAVKHGGEGPIEARIDYLPEAIELTVSNRANGSAPSEIPGAGAGLTGMRERTLLLGGTFEAGPTLYGWRVRATLPLEEQGQ